MSTSVSSAVMPARDSSPARTLVQSTMAVAIIDGLFAITVYVIVLERASVSGVFQGIASTVLGREAFQGGVPAALLGIAMHVGVAFAWSLLFWLAAMGWPALRRLIARPAGQLAVSAVFGPIVYVVMTRVVIPLLTQRTPPADGVWLAVLLGHIPFVALPIVWLVGRRLRTT